MKLACTAIALSLLAACPKRGSTPAGGEVAESGGGCPSARDVYLASYLIPESGQQGGHAGGWVLPLHFKQVASTEGVPSYARLDAAAASAAGVPQAPSSLWLLLPTGIPCKATIGSHYAAALDDGTPQLAYGVELSGCPAPPKEAIDATAIAVVSDASPSACRVVPPKPVAARLGETAASGTWMKPTQETPIPEAFAKIVPARECVAPACEKLWSIAQIDVGGKTVAWTGAVNWVTTSKDDPCMWPVDTFSGIFVAGSDGTPSKVTEGQDHPLALVGVLADGSGPKVMFASGPGEYTAYDLDPEGARVGRHVVWLIPHPESFAQSDRLGPDCGL